LKPPTQPNLFEALNLKRNIKHIIGDVRDDKHLLSVFKKYRPQFVFHLAAQPMVRLSYEEPKLTYETNVLGTVNVLEAIRKTNSVRVCVVVTSDKCYENKEILRGYKENDPMGGYDPYSSSKGCAELIIAAYRQSFFNPQKYNKGHKVALSSVRAGNMIGGGDWGNNRLVPDCVKAIAKNKTIVIRNPKSVRPWQYVLEPLGGYLWLGGVMFENGAKYSCALNFGPSNKEAILVKKIVGLVIKYWGKGKCKNCAFHGPHEAGLLRLDICKANRLIGWRPAYDLDTAIKRTVSWYREFYNKAGRDKLYRLSVEEINGYMARMRF